MMELWSPCTRTPNWALGSASSERARALLVFFLPCSSAPEQCLCSNLSRLKSAQKFWGFLSFIAPEVTNASALPQKLPQGSGIKFTPPQIEHCLFWVPFGALAHATSHMYKKMGILCHVSQGFSFWTLHFFSWSVRLAWQQQCCVCLCMICHHDPHTLICIGAIYK